MTTETWTCPDYTDINGVPWNIPIDQECPKCGEIYSREIEHTEVVTHVTHDRNAPRDRTAIIKDGYTTIADSVRLVGETLRIAEQERDWEYYGYENFTEYLDKHYEQSRQNLYRAIQVSKVSDMLGLGEGESVSMRQAQTVNQTPEIAPRAKELREQGKDTSEAIKQAESELPETIEHYMADVNRDSDYEAMEGGDAQHDSEGGEGNTIINAGESEVISSSAVIDVTILSNETTPPLGIESIDEDALKQLQEAHKRITSTHIIPPADDSLQQYVCEDCGGTRIGRTILDATDLPEWLIVLEDELPKAHRKLKWDIEWTNQLYRWWRLEDRTNDDEDTAMQVAESLVSYPQKPYRNYYMTFRKWFANQQEQNRSKKVSNGRY